MGGGRRNSVAQTKESAPREKKRGCICMPCGALIALYLGGYKIGIVRSKTWVNEESEVTMVAMKDRTLRRFISGSNTGLRRSG